MFIPIVSTELQVAKNNNLEELAWLEFWEFDTVQAREVDTSRKKEL